MLPEAFSMVINKGFKIFFLCVLGILGDAHVMHEADLSVKKTQMVSSTGMFGGYFVAGLFAALLVERIVHSIVFFSVDMFLGTSDGSLKRLASINSIQELFSFFTQLLAAIPVVIGNFVSYLVSKLF
jgi:hypothetical protein